MAVYFTLAVDCGQNEQAAIDVAARFDGFKFNIIADQTDKQETISCTSSAYNCRKYWNEKERENQDLPDWMMACVVQEINQGGKRYDLVTQPNLEAVRKHLYGRMLGEPDGLPPVTGYRSAKFGVESQDFLGDEDWPAQLEKFLTADEPGKYYEGLIFEESLLTNHKLREHLSVFSPGYLWWDCFPKRYF